jgi:hypothetical protein
VEVDGIGKPLFVAKASAANLDRFFPTNDAFRRTIAGRDRNTVDTNANSTPIRVFMIFDSL